MKLTKELLEQDDIIIYPSSVTEEDTRIISEYIRAQNALLTPAEKRKYAEFARSLNPQPAPLATRAVAPTRMPLRKKVMA